MHNKTSKKVFKIEKVYKQLICFYPNCNQTFANKLNFKLHLKTHTANESNKCEDSGDFSESLGLSLTNPNDSKLNRSFVCSYCSQRYLRHSRLLVHLRTHTGVKPFLCPYENCGKSFNEKGNLITHCRVHTNEKPFVCSYENCRRSFKAHGHLKDHMKKHYNIRPYVCSVCFQSFSRNSTLKMHLNTHVSTKPFKCPLPYCEKYFVDKAQIKYHMKIHYKEKSKEEFEEIFSKFLDTQRTDIDRLIELRNSEINEKTQNTTAIKPNLPKFVRKDNSYQIVDLNVTDMSKTDKVDRAAKEGNKEKNGLGLSSIECPNYLNNTSAPSDTFLFQNLDENYKELFCRYATLLSLNQTSLNNQLNVNVAKDIREANINANTNNNNKQTNEIKIECHDIKQSSDTIQQVTQTKEITSSADVYRNLDRSLKACINLPVPLNTNQISSALNTQFKEINGNLLNKKRSNENPSSSYKEESNRFTSVSNNPQNLIGNVVFNLFNGNCQSKAINSALDHKNLQKKTNTTNPSTDENELDQLMEYLSKLNNNCGSSTSFCPLCKNDSHSMMKDQILKCLIQLSNCFTDPDSLLINCKNLLLKEGDEAKEQEIEHIRNYLNARKYFKQIMGNLFDPVIANSKLPCSINTPMQNANTEFNNNINNQQVEMEKLNESKIQLREASKERHNKFETKGLPTEETALLKNGIEKNASKQVNNISYVKSNIQHSSINKESETTKAKLTISNIYNKDTNYTWDYPIPKNFNSGYNTPNNWGGIYSSLYNPYNINSCINNLSKVPIENPIEKDKKENNETSGFSFYANNTDKVYEDLIKENNQSIQSIKGLESLREQLNLNEQRVVNSAGSIKRNNIIINEGKLCEEFKEPFSVKRMNSVVNKQEISSAKSRGLQPIPFKIHNSFMELLKESSKSPLLQIPPFSSNNTTQNFTEVEKQALISLSKSAVSSAKSSSSIHSVKNEFNQKMDNISQNFISKVSIVNNIFKRYSPHTKFESPEKFVSSAKVEFIEKESNQATSNIIPSNFTECLNQTPTPLQHDSIKSKEVQGSMESNIKTTDV